MNFLATGTLLYPVSKRSTEAPQFSDALTSPLLSVLFIKCINGTKYNAYTCRQRVTDADSDADADWEVDRTEIQVQFSLEVSGQPIIKGIFVSILSDLEKLNFLFFIDP